MVPYALSAQCERVVYHNLEQLVCLDLRNGNELWRAPHVLSNTVGAASTLVISDGVALFHGHGQAQPERGSEVARQAPTKTIGSGMPSTTRWLTFAIASLVLLAVGVRLAWLGDDAFITLRSVENWVTGNGMRWNADERVQTFTHPLWMMLLALDG